AGSPLQVCEALCANSRLSPLARLSPRYLRHLIKDFLDAGWTGADILHALDHQPSGAAWTYTTPVGHAAGWVRFRLATWRNADGSPLPSRSQLSQLRRRDTLARQAERRRSRRAPDAPSAEYRAARQGAQRRKPRPPSNAAGPALRPQAARGALPRHQPERRRLGPRADERRLHAVPALPDDLRALTPAGLARVLLIVRSDD